MLAGIPNTRTTHRPAATAVTQLAVSAPGAVVAPPSDGGAGTVASPSRASLTDSTRGGEVGCTRLSGGYGGVNAYLRCVSPSINGHTPSAADTAPALDP